jgi:hypothetical protein
LIVGLAGAGFVLLCEKRIGGFLRRHSDTLIVSGLVLYILILGFATYSELFDLDWFRWASV